MVLLYHRMCVGNELWGRLLLLPHGKQDTFLLALRESTKGYVGDTGGIRGGAGRASLTTL